MAILVDRGTRLLVQGMTGREGRLHTELMLRYGTEILAGVTPGKGGESVEGRPVYNTVKAAVKEHPEINASILFVPAPHAAEAAYEAIDAGIELLIVITERIPVHDAVRFIEYGRRKGVKIVGPNCPGVMSPSECKVGIMPGHLFKKGHVGIVSRSGTLTYEVAWSLTRSGLGQSTAVGVGGDPVVGLDLLEVIRMFQDDPDTEAVVVIGEIGGDAEERLAEEMKNSGVGMPLVAYIAGLTAPQGKRMGHAGAIISMGEGTAVGKKDRLTDAGALVADIPSDIPRLVRKGLESDVGSSHVASLG
ncbi:MAG: succinate--CoA ligase subunit alpha [Nitrososphaerales archaeon]